MQDNKRLAKSGQPQFSQQYELSNLLSQIQATLNDAGTEFSNERVQLESLVSRLVNERLNLAILGQFKRGKSTFINALLGQELLPAAVVPLTAIPTLILWGSQIDVTVNHQNKTQKESYRHLTVEALNDVLSQIVTEQGNPHNEKKVSFVELSYPSPFLKNGVVLIDTPGIGSTLQHNTETTMDFLSQCDAAFFLISADPPITEVEVEFLRAVRDKVARIFFVINKADYLDNHEKDAFLNFFKKVLREKAGFYGEQTIFCVSSRQGLDASLRGDSGLFARSGIDRVKSFLLDFLSQGKREVLHQALAGKTSDIIGEALMRLQIMLNSMQMPLSHFDQSLKIFETKVKDAEQQRITAGDLLVGDRKRLVGYLEEQAEELRKKARKNLTAIVEKHLKSHSNSLKEERLVSEITQEIPAFFEAELKYMADTFNKKVTEVLGDHQQRADELIETVRRTAAELFDVPYQAPRSSEAFQMKKEPYWVTHKLDTKLSPIPQAIMSRLLPAGMKRSMMLKHYNEKIEELVINNVENLRWATLQNLDQAFRGFGSALDDRLQATIVSTHGALRMVKEKRSDHTRSMSPEISRLQNIKNQLETIQEQFQKSAELL